MASAGALPGWPGPVPTLLEREADPEPDDHPGDPRRPASRPVPDVPGAARRDAADEDGGESAERGDGFRSAPDRRAARYLWLLAAQGAAVPRTARPGGGLLLVAPQGSTGASLGCGGDSGGPLDRGGRESRGPGPRGADRPTSAF